MSGIIDLIVPREKKFFELIRKQVELLDKAAGILQTAISKKQKSKSVIGKNILLIEKYNDEVEAMNRRIIVMLHDTFITPIDREEIKALSTRVCVIVDSLEKIIIAMQYPGCDVNDKQFRKQLEIIFSAIVFLKEIFEEPLSPKRNQEKLNKIKNLERDADKLYRRAIVGLYGDGKKALEIIKTKELFDTAENTIDDIRITVELLETVLINNS